MVTSQNDRSLNAALLDLRRFRILTLRKLLLCARHSAGSWGTLVNEVDMVPVLIGVGLESSDISNKGKVAPVL
jgi:hypothetical protein